MIRFWMLCILVYLYLQRVYTSLKCRKEKKSCQTCETGPGPYKEVTMTMKRLRDKGNSGAVYGRDICKECYTQIEKFMNHYGRQLKRGCTYHVTTECTHGDTISRYLTEEDYRRLIWFLTWKRLPNTLYSIFDEEKKNG